MPILKLLPDIYVPTFEMKVNDRPLPPSIAKMILEISVTEHLNPPNQFSVRLNDPALTVIDAQDGLFTEGSRVEISLGYVGNTRKMITGEISALTPDFPEGGPATVEVEGFDLLHRLTRGTVYRRFEGPTPDSGVADGDVASQISSEMGLVPSVDASQARAEARVQDHITNLAFVETLAGANGYFLWVDGETLHFKRERPAADTIRLEWGKTLMSVSPRLSTAGQVNAVEVRGWDAVRKQSFSVRVERARPAQDELAPTGQRQLAQGAGGRSEIVITGAPVSSAQEARAHAEAILSQQQRSTFTASGTCVGEPDMHAATNLELLGIGRFGGTYVVERVTHTLGSGGYRTSFQVRRRV